MRRPCRNAFNEVFLAALQHIREGHKELGLSEIEMLRGHITTARETKSTKRGCDLTDATTLKFCAHGERGGEDVVLLHL